MRCAEVIRELAVPSDGRDATALAEHLSSCQSCAGWAQQATRLDEIWKATSPREPELGTWDTVWTDIVGAFDAPSSLSEGLLPIGSTKESGLSFTARFDAGAADAIHEKRSRRHSLVALGLIGLAQAAAVLIAVGMGWHHARFDPNPIAISQASNETVSVEIEEGRTILIRSDGSQSAVVDLTPNELVHGVDDFYVMFNALESMATNSNLAMRE